MHRINKISTLLLFGVEGYSTLVGKRDSREPARSAAEEAARRSPTGSSALRESEASAAKRVEPGTEIILIKAPQHLQDFLYYIVFNTVHNIILS